MPIRDIPRAALMSIIAAAIILGLRSKRTRRHAISSIPVTRGRGVSLASRYRRRQERASRSRCRPEKHSKIIDLGVAQSGARQFREAIATHAGARDRAKQRAAPAVARASISSVREFDRAFADLTRAARSTARSMASGTTSVSSSTLRGDFADAAASFARAQPIARTPPNWRVPRTGCGCRSAGRARHGREGDARSAAGGSRDQRLDAAPAALSWRDRSRRRDHARGTDEVQVATLA